MPSQRPVAELDKDRAYHKALYDQRKKEGLCTSCGDPAIGGKILCERCRVRNCARVRRDTTPSSRGLARRKIDTSRADELPLKPKKPRMVAVRPISCYVAAEDVEWLKQQPEGVSATVRRLVHEAAQKDRKGQE